jgi:hypothetical protein
MEVSELAQDNIEQAHIHGDDRSAPRVAVLIAALAAVLAVAETGEKSSQNAYMTHHVQAADYWALFQARNIRATVQSAAASMMESLSNSADPAVRQRIDTAHADAVRLRDDPKAGTGSRQVEQLARAEERDREIDFHRYHLFEAVVGALQIAIVLASVSVVTRVPWLAYGAAAIGGMAGLFGLVTAAGLI